MSAYDIGRSINASDPSNLLTIDDIPNCSIADRKIMEMITDSDVDLDQLADSIQENPSLTALIIGLANSAYFSAPSSINSIKDAIIKVLGIRMVKSLVLSVILGKSLDVSNCTSFSLEAYWANSLSCAQFCQYLGKHTLLSNYASADEIYLSALLSGFGELVMIQHYAEEMNELIQITEHNLPVYIEAQSNVLGITQADAGVLMATRWVLPDITTEVLQHAFNTSYRGENWQLCLVVGEVLNLVNKLFLGDADLSFSSTVEEVLGKKSADCGLELLPDLRSSLSLIAKHLAGGS